MKDSKFFVLFGSLEAQEVSAFHKYLKQMHGGEDTALLLFEYARKLHPRPWDEKKLNLEYAFRKIFKADIATHKHGRKKVLNTLSDLYLWLKDFLLTEKALNDPLTKQVLWLSILRKKRLEAAFDRESTRFYDEKDNLFQAFPNEQKQYLVHLAASYFHFRQLASVRPSPDMGAMQQCLDTMETSLEIIKMKMSCVLANSRKIHAGKPGTPASFPETEPARNGALEPNALLEIYRAIYLLIGTEQEEHYTRIEQLLHAQAGALDSEERHEIFTYLYNFVAIQVRKPNNQSDLFAQKLHELNQFGLQYDVFKQTGNLSLSQFTNIVNIACARKDYVWAARFIEQQNYLLEDPIRESSIQLARATIYFEEKKYKQVLDTLQAKEYKHVHYILRSRQLILRSYFELGEEYDTTWTYCLAFEAWLLRHRRPRTEAVEACLEFVRVCKSILQEKTDKEALLKRIREKPSLVLRPWLLQQVLNYRGRSAARKRHPKQEHL